VPTKRKLPLIAASTGILLATIGAESAARNLDGDLTYARSQGGQTVHRVPTNPDGAGDTAGWLTRALTLNTGSAGGSFGISLPRNAAVSPPAQSVGSSGGATSSGGGAVFASSSGHASFSAGVPVPRPENPAPLAAPPALEPPTPDDPPACDPAASDPSASDPPACDPPASEPLASDPPDDQQSADNSNGGSSGNGGTGGTGGSGDNPIPFADDQKPANTTRIADELLVAPTPGIGNVALVTPPDLQAAAIDEPKGLMLLGVALIGLSLWRLRRLA
jgi:hypothetical protein